MSSIHGLSVSTDLPVLLDLGSHKAPIWVPPRAGNFPGPLSEGRQSFYSRGMPHIVTSDERKCRQLIDRWDRIHCILDPRRLERFELMMDLLEASLPRKFVALDLGAGPGPLSKRIIERFPEARVIAVDHNPVHTRIGQIALEGFGERSQWVTLDLRGSGWDERLPVRRMDAVVTSQTFHDIDPGRLREVYCTLGARLRPKGVLLNSDWMPWDRSWSRFGRLYEKVAEIRKRDGRQADRLHFHRDYMKWWEDAKKARSLQEVLGLRMESSHNKPWLDQGLEV